MSDVKCWKCGKKIGGNVIQCSLCERWIHQRCVPMSAQCLNEWFEHSWIFICPDEALTPAGFYDVDAALKRLGGSIDAPESTRLKVVRSERLMLQTYKVKLPSIRTTKASPLLPGKEDKTAIEILQLFHPIILKDYRPLQVKVDGNCMFRVLSRGLYSDETHHTLIRLLAALEMSEHREYYDVEHKDYQDLINDSAVICDSYANLLDSVCRDGGCSELLHMYASSAALGVCVTSYCPPMLSECEIWKSLNRRIYGREVRVSKQPHFTLMWSMTVVPQSSFNYVPDHFTLLHKLRPIKPMETKPTNQDARTDVSQEDEEEEEDEEGYASHSMPSPPLIQSAIDSITPDDQLSDSVCTIVTSNLNSSPPPPPSPQSQSAARFLATFITDTPKKKPEKTQQESFSVPLRGDESPAQGGYPLPIGQRGHKFLEITDILSAVCAPLNAPEREIPRGIKENVYFVVDNTSNIERKQMGLKNLFWDDCGSWNTKTTVSHKSIFFCTQNMDLKKIVLHDGVYCIHRPRKNTRDVYEPLDPQPEQSSLITVCRYYAKHSLSMSYERRITWLVMNDSEAVALAVYEYKGKFPGRAPHRLSHSDQEYVRIKPSVMNFLKEAVLENDPKKIFQETSFIDGPRSLKNIQDIRYKQRKLKRSGALKKEPRVPG